MKYEIRSVGPIDANCCIVWDETQTAEPTPCWLIDPGADAEVLIDFCAKRRLEPVVIALTHGHFDHIGAIPDLLAKWPTLPVHVGPADEAVVCSPLNSWAPYYPGIARPATLVPDLVDGATLTAGGLTAQILATPGHTPGGVCIHFAAAQTLFTGDTLFAGSCGRTDFPGGSFAQLSESLRRLVKLPGETVVVPGHGETTTISDEIAHNPFLR